MIKLNVKRKIDTYNRLSVPIKICRQLGWEQGTILYCLQLKGDDKLYVFDDLKIFSEQKNFDVEKVENLQSRKMDILNRIVIPKPICDELNITRGDMVEVKFIDDYLIAEKG